MKALVYNGPRQVSVKDVPDARIEKPTDVLVRITSTNICGSDLHMYEGRTDIEQGRVFGHENLGEVVEVGDGVDKVEGRRQGLLPFNISCGHCENCERGLTNYCLRANRAGHGRRRLRLRRHGSLQRRAGRVPARARGATSTACVCREDAEEKQDDYVMLSDIFPTGWHATEMAGLQAGGDDRHLRRRPRRADGRALGDVKGAAR